MLFSYDILIRSFALAQRVHFSYSIQVLIPVVGVAALLWRALVCIKADVEPVRHVRSGISRELEPCDIWPAIALSYKKDSSSHGSENG